MKNFNLEDLEIQELNENELVKIEGGSVVAITTITVAIAAAAEATIKYLKGDD